MNDEKWTVSNSPKKSETSASDEGKAEGQKTASYPRSIVIYFAIDLSTGNAGKVLDVLECGLLIDRRGLICGTHVGAASFVAHGLARLNTMR